jgi:hypothetical protein
MSEVLESARRQPQAPIRTQPWIDRLSLVVVCAIAGAVALASLASLGDLRVLSGISQRHDNLVRIIATGVWTIVFAAVVVGVAGAGAVRETLRGGSRLRFASAVGLVFFGVEATNVVIMIPRWSAHMELWRLCELGLLNVLAAGVCAGLAWVAIGFARNDNSK